MNKIHITVIVANTKYSTNPDEENATKADFIEREDVDGLGCVCIKIGNKLLAYVGVPYFITKEIIPD